MTRTGTAGLLVGGRYRLDTVLGRGGMGVVWSGMDTLLERPVAMKEVRLPNTVDEEERLRISGRVLREARAAARLNHRGVVTVYDVVDEDEQPYIVMELVRAPSLAEVVSQRGPLTPDRVAEIGAGIAGALGSAHRQGIIHRDVKPANVLVPDGGGARLTDFGIASIADDPGATTTQRLVGSPPYMSPEQATNGELSAASDRWSLGATLYYAVEGVPPFDRGEAIPTLTSILSDPPRPPERAGPLGPILLDLLTKDPADRPSDDELQSALAGFASRTQPIGAFPTRTKPAVAVAPEPATRDSSAVRPAAPAFPEPAARDSSAVRLAAPAFPEPAARDSSAVPPAVPAPLHRPAPRRSPVLVGVAILLGALVVAVMAIGAAMALRTSHHGTGSAAASGPVPATAHPAGPSASTTKASTAPVAAGWVAYHDPATGYTISHPPSWTVSTRGTLTDFRDPTTGAYLRVDHISPPHANAEADWRAYEPAFAAANPGYQRIQIAATTFQGFPAATWEYTYGSGAQLHAVDLGFIVGSTYGFALNFQAPAGDWQRLQPEFAAFQQSFHAPTG